MTAAFVFGVSAFIFENTYADTFYPGVVIGGEHVEGKTYSDVVAEIGHKIKTLEDSGFQVAILGAKGVLNIHIPMQDSGLTSDTVVQYFSIGNWESSVQTAYEWGRSGGMLQNISRKIGLFFGGKEFNLPISANPEAIKALIADETSGLIQGTVPAEFSLTSKGISILKEQPGETVDEAAIEAASERGLQDLDTTALTFKAQSDLPLATEDSLTPFIGLADQLSKKAKITLYYNDHKWAIAPKTLVSWLTLKSKEELGINNDKLNTFLSKTVAPLIDDPPQNSRFEIQGGQLVEIQAGKAGEVVDVAKTADKISAIIPKVQKSFAATGNISLALGEAASVGVSQVVGGVLKIPIDVIHADPKITKDTISQFKIKDLVGYASTNFAGGSLARQQNIATGAEKLNGLLIAPGEEFSTVNGLGPTTEEAGFVKEYVIKGDKTVKEIGGGLCQVATTLFRTALNAGLPITDRTNHSFIIHYYGPGLDATIYGPEPDLKFVNDTGNYLLLQGAAKNNEVTFELYGVQDGRKVEISKPILSNLIPAPPTRFVPTAELSLGETKCSEIPKEGITADVTYTVTYADGMVKVKTFHSVYAPWQKVCLVGTAP